MDDLSIAKGKTDQSRESLGSRHPVRKTHFSVPETIEEGPQCSGRPDRWVATKVRQFPRGQHGLWGPMDIRAWLTQVRLLRTLARSSRALT